MALKTTNRTHGILLTKDPWVQKSHLSAAGFSRHKPHGQVVRRGFEGLFDFLYLPCARWTIYMTVLFLGKCFLRFDEKTMKNSRKPGMLFVSLSVWVVFDYNS